MIGLPENRRTLSVPEFFSQCFKFYRDHFGLFWQVMMPLLILSVLLDVAALLWFYHGSPNTLWVLSTSEGFSVTAVFGTDERWFSFTSSSFIYLFLWFAMCPLILTTFLLIRGMNISVQGVWQQTFRKIGTILGASLLLAIAVIVFLGGCLLISSLLLAVIPLFVVGALIFIAVMVYFSVRWSLFNQCIIIENLPALQAFRRSSQLVQGRWWHFFVRYLLLLWGSGVLVSLVFASTFLLLSPIVSEFMPIRDELMSGRFLMLFTGIDISASFSTIEINFGDIEMPLSGTPGFATIAVILI